MISKRTSGISCDTEQFDKASPDCDYALRKSYFKENLNICIQ